MEEAQLEFLKEIGLNTEENCDFWSAAMLDNGNHGHCGNPRVPGWLVCPKHMKVTEEQYIRAAYGPLDPPEVELDSFNKSLSKNQDPTES